MNKIVSIKNANAIFLGIVLIAGTFAAISPSFIVGAQAESYYGQDNNYKKANGKDVNVKSIKCNNINVNVNGLELDVTSAPFLSNLLASEAQADEDERGASSYGSGGQSGYDNNNSFKFVCINNNNNTVVEENNNNTVVEEPLEPLTCEECFGASAILQAAILDVIDDPGTTIQINNEVGGVLLFIGEEVDTIEDLCVLLEGLDIPLTNAQLERVITVLLLINNSTVPEAEIDALIECLL